MTSLLQSPPPKGKPQEVILEATGKVKVVYSLDNGASISLDLNPAEMHTFKGKSKIHLEISDGGAANLIVNGRDRGPAGDSGKPTNMNFPR